MGSSGGRRRVCARARAHRGTRRRKALSGLGIARCERSASEEGLVVPCGLARLGGSCRWHDRGRQQLSSTGSKPCRTSGQRVIDHSVQRGRPGREAREAAAGGATHIAPPPGVEGTGNGTSAPAGSMGPPTRASARGTGGLGEPLVRGARAPGSGAGRSLGARDDWSVAETVKEHLWPRGARSSEHTSSRH